MILRSRLPWELQPYCRWERNRMNERRRPAVRYEKFRYWRFIDGNGMFRAKVRVQARKIEELRAILRGAGE